MFIFDIFISITKIRFSGECIRMMAAIGGIELENVRIQAHEWEGYLKNKGALLNLIFTIAFS